MASSVNQRQCANPDASCQENPWGSGSQGCDNNLIDDWRNMDGKVAWGGYVGGCEGGREGQGGESRIGAGDETLLVRAHRGTNSTHSPSSKSAADLRDAISKPNDHLYDDDDDLTLSGDNDRKTSSSSMAYFTNHHRDGNYGKQIACVLKEQNHPHPHHHRPRYNHPDVLDAADDNPDDSSYFLISPGGELESPGNVSQISDVTTASSRSTHSRAVLLRRGDTEKDAMIENRLAMAKSPNNNARGEKDEEGREEEEDEEEEEDYDCSIGRFRPACLQWCANVKMFVLVMCVLVVVQTSLTTGYLNGVITTIEKRFEIGSSISGLITASYEFGNMVAVIFVSFLGANRHIPKWIGSGALLMATGSLLFTLPHTIAPKYTVRSGVTANETGEDNICRGADPDSDPDCIGETDGNLVYVLTLVVAQILIGTGGTPIMTLGVTYIDNHVTKEKSPAYLACVHASSALGPVIGYAVAALFNQFYVDSFSFDVSITPSSPLWIGAWWGGFVITGILLFILAFPFLAFPRVLWKERRELMEAKSKEEVLLSLKKGGEEEGGEEEKDVRNVKDIPAATLSLLRNPVYTIMLPAICCEFSIVSGFVTFLPKYIESQFGTSKSLASLFTGGFAIPGAVIGILMGGYILKKMALSPKGAIQFVLLLNTLALCGFSLLFILGCNPPKMAGANIPYFNSSGHELHPYQANLTSPCNQNCACSPNKLQPICGVNGITYFSPCHAGCTRRDMNAVLAEEEGDERTYNYTGCSCISHGPGGQMRSSGGHEVVISPMATSGACKNTCDRLPAFLILLVFLTTLVAGTQMPLLMVTLRSVRTSEGSFAIGLQFVMMRLFAYIPSPIYFGNSIDASCKIWSTKCGRNGSCLLYDIESFRYAYVGISGGLKIVSLCFFIAVWYFIRKRTLRELEDAKHIEAQVTVPALDEKPAFSSSPPNNKSSGENPPTPPVFPSTSKSSPLYPATPELHGGSPSLYQHAYKTTSSSLPSHQPSTPSPSHTRPTQLPIHNPASPKKHHIPPDLNAAVGGHGDDLLPSVVTLQGRGQGQLGQSAAALGHHHIPEAGESVL